MESILQFPADLVTFTEEILNGKLYFLCSASTPILYRQNHVTIMDMIFWDFLVLYEIFLSPQVKQSVIISNKHSIYELPHELPNNLEVQSCKLYSNKCMINSTQIMNTKVFAFIAGLTLKLLGRKVLLINRKNNRNC